jgi:hypothetical protein
MSSDARVDVDLFERVFSDAHVVDVDFSNWDLAVGLWVLADHFEDWKTRCPLVDVEFYDVRQFLLNIGDATRSIARPDRHVQWNIAESSLVERDSHLIIDLFGAQESAPQLHIECGSVRFRRVDNTILDRLFPQWAAPYSGLARPGIDALSKN